MKQIDTRKRNIVLADTGLLLTALFWGGGFVAGDFALQDFGPFEAYAYRFIGASILMGLCCIRKLPKIDRNVLVLGVLMGILMVTSSCLQIVGLQYTTPGKQSFIISLYTVIVPLLTWLFYKVKPSGRIIGAAFLALAGVALLTLTEKLTIGYGDTLTFLFVLIFSLQMIFTARYIKNMDAMLVTFVEMVTAAVIATVLALLTGQWASAESIAVTSWVGLVYMVVFAAFFAFLLQNICLRFAPASHAAILLSTETVFGTICAVVLTGEVFRGRMLLGGILMLAALAVAEFPEKKKATEVT